MSTRVVGVTGYRVCSADGESPATPKLPVNITLLERSISGRHSTSTECFDIQANRRFLANVTCQFTPAAPIRLETPHAGGKCHEEFKTSATRFFDFVLLRSFHARCAGAVPCVPPRDRE